MLNDANVAWIEKDYNRREHRELGTTPEKRLAESTDAYRPCPGSDALKAAFRIIRECALGRSYGTVSVEGIRYQMLQPSRQRGQCEPACQGTSEGEPRRPRGGCCARDMLEAPRGRSHCPHTAPVP